MSRLADKVALITGASSGLGRAIALAFAAQGARLVVCADLQPAARPEIAEETTRATHELIQDRHGLAAARFVQVDGTKTTDVVACLAEVVKIGGHLDILVNCIGGGVQGLRFHEISDQEWDASLKAAIRYFLAQGPDTTTTTTGLETAPSESSRRTEKGNIINVASVYGLVAHAGGAAYCAVKAAVVNLSRGIALDYATDGIRCNALCPAHVVTAYTKQWFDDPAIAASMKGRIPLWRETGKDDVASAAVFLASSVEAGWITGAAMPVDGGYSAQ